MKRVLLDVDENMTRVALVEDGELIELYYDPKKDGSLLGNIYVGQVESVIPNLQACFINIGAEKNGYLYYGRERAVSDTVKNTSRPKVGDSLLVQVEKDALGEKGAVLSSEISFPGKFTVLLADDNSVRVSKKITDTEERKRIQSIVRELLPEGFGAIIRTNGEGKTREELEKEIVFLAKRAEKIKNWEYNKPPFCLLSQSVPLEKAVRDFYGRDIEEFVINDENSYNALAKTRDFNGEGQPRLKLYNGAMPIFQEYGVEAQTKKAIEKKVWLKSGGFLIIEETEACVVIDVNSGKAAGRGDLERAALKTNIEAAREAAKQLRLRNLSGIIIIDFIDMSTQENKNILRKTLEQAVVTDRIKTVVIGMTELGLMQLTRKKTRPAISRQLMTKCRQCDGLGRMPSISYTVAAMRRETEGILANTIYDKITVKGDKRLLIAFAGGEDEPYLKKTEEKFNAEITCEEEENTFFGEYEIIKSKREK